MLQIYIYYPEHSKADIARVINTVLLFSFVIAHNLTIHSTSLQDSLLSHIDISPNFAQH